MKRRILKADVTRLALCKRGKNSLQTLYKGEGAAFSALVKAAPGFEERGELLFVAAVPGLDFSDGDFYGSADAVRDSAHAFLRNGGQLDIEHDGKVLGKSDAVVVESFVIQKGDPRFEGWKDYAGAAVNVDGGWGGLIKIDSPALRKSYASGEWDGVSLYAPSAQLQVIEKSEGDALLASLRNLFAGLAGTPNTNSTEDDSMTPEQIAALSKSIVDGIAAALKPVEAKPEPKVETIAFEGDINDPAALRKHEAKLRAAALLKSGDLNDPAKVAELIKAADEKVVDPKVAREELRKSNPVLAKTLDDADAANARVATLSKSSNQPEPKDGEVSHAAKHAFVAAGLTKGEDKNMGEASKVAATLNARRFPEPVKS